MIYEEIVAMISKTFDIPEQDLNENTNLINDIGIDSVDVVELVVELENEFGLDEIPEEELRKMATIGDLAAYVSAHSAQ